ncbi:MAG TPA: hypothetical protein VMU00_10345 [Steroidobacteraceae bacterium]|nr:hypothetical protein [Steroidobacteraceae bacterium]
MPLHRCLPIVLGLALGIAGCGAEPPPPKPAPTVFDPLLKKKETVPAAVEAAQAQHDADTRRQIEEAEGSPPPEARR